MGPGFESQRNHWKKEKGVSKGHPFSIHSRPEKVDQVGKFGKYHPNDTLNSFIHWLEVCGV